jgi:hypothetical protein
MRYSITALTLIGAFVVAAAHATPPTATTATAPDRTFRLRRRRC